MARFGAGLNDSPSRRFVMPLGAAIVWVAFGLFLFGALGGVYGRFEEPIKENIKERVLDHPGVLEQGVGETEGAKSGAASAKPSDEEQAGAIAEQAWSRLKFFHGHGTSMVLASFVAFLLIANARISIRTKRWLTWIGLASMTLYNVGWFFAGALVGWLSLDDAKKVGEFGFFIPFGVVTVLVWAVIAVVWARELLGPHAGVDVPTVPGTRT